MAKRLVISNGGQVSVPAAVRKRWQTRTVLAEDLGDRVVLRPVPDDPVAAAVGAFATEIGVLSSEEAKRLDREEELEVQDRSRR
ncbi:MAG TPA: AbrB/MazE/SpoVT family DNA-binding domain-containing protein [Solirubrobacteraceae bacterium]|nr:AbrB/MazE/SpoVT family DNA-binding domain-containing protein [Solirubrobacteraceae bacterium]